MILRFKTDRDINGNSLYLAIDTKAECYATTPRGWLCKEYPVIKKRDYRYILGQLEENNFLHIDNM